MNESSSTPVKLDATASAPVENRWIARWHVSPVRLAIAALIVTSLIHLWFAARIELVPDEAYYWVWSKHLDASYREKGPAVAWTIALRRSIEVL